MKVVVNLLNLVNGRKLLVMLGQNLGHISRQQWERWIGVEEGRSWGKSQEAIVQTRYGIVKT